MAKISLKNLHPFLELPGKKLEGKVTPPGPLRVNSLCAFLKYNDQISFLMVHPAYTPEIKVHL